VDLDTATDQVYAATPDDFMSVRTALVAEAKQAKDRELAKAIGALRKPTRSAWMINLLARSEPDEVGGLLDLGAALREAQAQLSGPELRKLSAQRQKAVAALVRRAGALAADHGHRATDTQLQEVGQHLQAALADPDLAEDVRAGRVAQIVTFGGFGPWEAGAAATGPAPSKAETATAAPAAEPEPPTAPAGPTPAEIQEARDAWKQTRAAVRDAQSELTEARTAGEAASAELDRLRAELAEAERTAAAGDVRRGEAEERLTTARAAAEEAERRLEELLD
jgi:hypothetical protein